MTQSNTGMKFIEMTGATLSEIVGDGELHDQDLRRCGVSDDSIVRVNQHGDIEVRRANKWAIIGGLLGQFEQRVKQKTGFDWA
jgi:hypothetical protein